MKHKIRRLLKRKVDQLSQKETTTQEDLEALQLITRTLKILEQKSGDLPPPKLPEKLDKSETASLVKVLKS